MKQNKPSPMDNITSNAQRERFNFWLDRFTDAQAKRRPLVDDKVALRNKLYSGVRQKDGNGVESKCLRNMCFELIESQINNAIPQPKVTPTDTVKSDLAHNLESFLRMEMDRLQSEITNDKVERGVLKQGTHFYEVGWDDTIRAGRGHGGIVIKDRPIQDVWLQPGVMDFDSIEYAFVFSRESQSKLKKLTGKLPPESPNFKGMTDMITCWYYDDDGYVCRLTWAENTNYIIFDDRDYESRRVRVCTECQFVTNLDVCPVCGATTFTTKSVHEETLPDNIVKGDPTNPNGGTLVMARKGDKIPYYAIKKIPLVMRTNISSDESIYGISDIDILAEDQLSSNNVLTKIEQNILKAGSIVTIPDKMNFKLTNETLKVVRLKDPKWANAVDVKNIQASIQQDDILSDRVYQFGRSSLGITDSYQGKRDPTAESGKAKEISAAQAAGRMESKRKMKDAAYANLYQMMFYFFLAYCDDGATFLVDKANGQSANAKIRRYDFLDGEVGNLYYDDTFIFSVDTASVLYTSREAMWAETTNNYAMGTMGDPADPRTQMLYWRVMKDLNYPLAKTCLEDITNRYNMQQQAMMQQQAVMQQQMAAQAQQQQLADEEAVNAAMAQEIQKMMGGNKQ